MRRKEIEATLPELERMLTITAGKHVRRSSKARRIGGWRASRVALVGAACLAFGGTAMAATGVWSPSIGSEASYSPPPRLATNGIPAEQVAALGVLSREPDAQDRGPEVEKTLTTLGSYFADGIRPDSVRYLEPRGEHGEAVILFSAESSVFTDSPDPVCVATPSRGGAGATNGEAGAECFEFDKILAGEAFTSVVGFRFEDGEATSPGHGEGSGLVPDGVASVTAEFDNGFELTVPVTDNYFKFAWDPADAGETGATFDEAKRVGPSRIVWYDAEGAVVPYS
jgi:hypothetical protein